MRLRSVVTLGLILALTSAACDPSTETGEREAAAYTGLVRAVVGPEPFAELDDRRGVVVWIYPLGDEPIDLDVQVAVLERLDDFATVRFVDEFVEAIDEGETGMPVLEDGVAVGLGPLRQDRSRARVERYESEADEPRRFTASHEGDGWELIPTDR